MRNKVYRAGAKTSFVLSMKNGLPYLSKELFWRAMKDIAAKAKLVSGHDWTELRETLDNRTYEPQPQVYAVKTIAVSETPKVLLSQTPHTKYFSPVNVRKQIVEWFEHFHPAPNPNRGRLSGTAPSLTFGAQTGRGSDRSCVIKRTLDYNFHSLITNLSS